mmetsp:Transcript_94881/g.268247  ORF Transcript_94881/g.268247 Transcript_94881/m.268247 type:complete len:273 (-) Transcript_94881:573-1391(-)
MLDLFLGRTKRPPCHARISCSICPNIFIIVSCAEKLDTGHPVASPCRIVTSCVTSESTPNIAHETPRRGHKLRTPAASSRRNALGRNSFSPSLGTCKSRNSAVCRSLGSTVWRKRTIESTADSGTANRRSPSSSCARKEVPASLSSCSRPFTSRSCSASWIPSPSNRMLTKPLRSPDALRAYRLCARVAAVHAATFSGAESSGLRNAAQRNSSDSAFSAGSPGPNNCPNTSRRADTASGPSARTSAWNMSSEATRSCSDRSYTPRCSSITSR